MDERLHGRNAWSRERSLVWFTVMFYIWLNFERDIWKVEGLFTHKAGLQMYIFFTGTRNKTHWSLKQRGVAQTSLLLPALTILLARRGQQWLCIWTSVLSHTCWQMRLRHQDFRGRMAVIYVSWQSAAYQQQTPSLQSHSLSLILSGGLCLAQSWSPGHSLCNYPLQ